MAVPNKIYLPATVGANGTERLELARKLRDACSLILGASPPASPYAKHTGGGQAAQITPTAVARLVTLSNAYVIEYGGLVAGAIDAGLKQRYRRATTKTRHQVCIKTLVESLAGQGAAFVDRRPGTASSWAVSSAGTFFDELDEDGERDWVIESGTSNGVGDTDISGGRAQAYPTPANSEPDPDVPAYYRGSGQTPSNWDDGLGDLSGAVSVEGTQVALQAPQDRWGSELSMIRVLKAAGWRPALIKCARGGAREDLDYVEGQGADIYTDMLAMIAQALDELGPPRRIIWVHIGGENVAGASPGAFAAPMTTLRTAVKAALGDYASRLVHVVQLLHSDWADSEHSGYRPSYATIRAEQLAYAAADSQTYTHDPSGLAGVGAQPFLQTDVTADGGVTFNGLHISGPGHDANGQALAALAITLAQQGAFNE